MRTIAPFPLLLSLFLPLLSSALMVPPQLHLSPVKRAAAPVAASAFYPEDDAVAFETTPKAADQKLFLKVRQELVQKYLDQGEELSKAEQEVDYFLSDSARSQEYMEMRKYNLSQLDDGLGLDLFMTLQFVSAFLIGFMLHELPNGNLAMNAGFSFFWGDPCFLLATVPKLIALFLFFNGLWVLCFTQPSLNDACQHAHRYRKRIGTPPYCCTCQHDMYAVWNHKFWQITISWTCLLNPSTNKEKAIVQVSDLQTADMTITIIGPLIIQQKQKETKKGTYNMLYLFTVGIKPQLCTYYYYNERYYGLLFSQILCSPWSCTVAVVTESSSLLMVYLFLACTGKTFLPVFFGRINQNFLNNKSVHLTACQSACRSTISIWHPSPKLQKVLAVLLAVL